MNKAQELTHLADSNRAKEVLQSAEIARELVKGAISDACNNLNQRYHGMQLNEETELTRQTVVELLEAQGFDPEISGTYIEITW